MKVLSRMKIGKKYTFECKKKHKFSFTFIIVMFYFYYGCHDNPLLPFGCIEYNNFHFTVFFIIYFVSYYSVNVYKLYQKI